MKGVQDQIEVFDDKVTITPKGILALMNKGLKGTKTIPFSSISAIQFKEAGAVFSGYLQFTIPGGNESKGGVFSAASDENTFMFAQKKNNALATQIKEYIEFVRSFTEAANIMSKNFFIVVPFNPTPTDLSSGINTLLGKNSVGVLDETQFSEYRQQLEQRASLVEQGLSGIGVRTIALQNEELVELYYHIFNPGDPTGKSTPKD